MMVIPMSTFLRASPYVLAVGGSKIMVAGNAIAPEITWNDGQGGATGGGISDFFPLPSWQSHVDVPSVNDGHKGRAIPDVAANASPTSGYKAYIAGREEILGGTAAATPLWAGLIALIDQNLGHSIGYFNPLLYSKLGPAGNLRNLTEGNNSVHGVKGYMAGPGWNAVTGWGSPDGKKLLEALRSN